MCRPKASLGLVLLGLLGLAGWGCSKGPSPDDAGKTGGPEVKKSDDADSPRSGRSGRAVGKVLRKMQAEEMADARDMPPGVRTRKYPAKTTVKSAPPWETGAGDFRPPDRPAKTGAFFKTQAKTMYEIEKTKTEQIDKTEANF